MQFGYLSMAGRKRKRGNQKRSKDRFKGRKEVADAVRLGIEANQGEVPIHPLYCVSEKLYGKIRANAIIVHQYERLKNDSVPNGITKYQFFSVGSNLQKVVSHSSSSQPIDLRFIKHQYFVILAPKEELQQNPLVHLVGSITSSKYVLLLWACYKAPSAYTGELIML